MGVAANLTHIFIVYQNRKHHIAFADEHGGSEISQAGHKYHNGSCCNGWKHHGQGNGPQPAQLIASQILRSLLQAGINASHGP